MSSIPGRIFCSPRISGMAEHKVGGDGGIGKFLLII